MIIEDPLEWWLIEYFENQSSRACSAAGLECDVFSRKHIIMSMLGKISIKVKSKKICALSDSISPYHCFYHGVSRKHMINLVCWSAMDRWLIFISPDLAAAKSKNRIVTCFLENPCNFGWYFWREPNDWLCVAGANPSFFFMLVWLGPTHLKLKISIILNLFGANEFNISIAKGPLHKQFIVAANHLTRELGLHLGPQPQPQAAAIM